MIANPEAISAYTHERIFWPRSSEAVDQLAQVLSDDPERPLSDVEKAAVLAFEQNLFIGTYEEKHARIALKELQSSEDNTVELVPEYFATQKGATELKESIGVMLDITEGHESVSRQLQAIPFELLKDETNKKKLQILQGNSLRYLKSLYASMAQGEIQTRDIERITLIKDPGALLDRLDVLQSNRVFVREVRSELDRHSDENVVAAKVMVTDIYRDKINSQIAAAYPSLIELNAQIALQTNPLSSEQTEHLGIILRTAKTAERSTDSKTQFVRLLDYVRNGAALDDAGRLTPIDGRLFEAVESLNTVAVPTGESYFTSAETAQLKELVFDSLEMKAFIDVYLQRTGLVEHGWESELRSDLASFSLSAIHKLVKVPQNFNSAVARDFPATGVVGLIEHEIGGISPGHVVQSVNASLNPGMFEIARSPKFRGKRYLAMRESGGTAAEASGMQRYFGQTRRFSTSYASAMEVLLAGKPQAEAIKAFADAQIGDRTVNEAETKKAYEIAADRVLRLLRFGGFNSQPLQYVEAATIRRVVSTMPDAISDVMFAEAVYDPVDMIRLHRFGLLKTDDHHRYKFRENPVAVVTELLRERLAAG